ncbi:sialate O-acetylesterase [Paenibacillus sp. GCM10023252]|uniref:sialate O-acetylesterase n=1 Tax=Paenibacillus sp. GCM10023252 TaxID=3252649 RepID=UPI003619017C
MSNLRLNAIYGDGMVIQQGQPIRIAGTASEGAEVAVTIGDQRAAAFVQEGSWSVELPPLTADGRIYDLHVASGAEALLVQDIVVGEVWVAGGQSNMEWTLKQSAGGNVEAAAAHYPAIRYYNVPHVAWEEEGAEPAADCWRACTPEHAPDYSAVAYYFAKQLHERLAVPIGIIGCNWGGTSASCWVEEAVLREDEQLAVYLQEYEHTCSSYESPEDYEQQKASYQALVNAYNERALALGNQLSPVLDEHKEAYPWPPPVGPDSFLRPSGLYHTMLQKIVSYSVRGAIFYQGESDTAKAHLYERLLTGLIANWRRDWQLPNMPFLFVQLPGYNENPTGEDWPLMREAQQGVSQRVPNTAMAVSIDCGDPNDIHPIIKRPIGERLALLAREHVYGQSVEANSPVPSSIEADYKGMVLVTFAHVYGGLLGAEEGLDGFELAGADGIYYAAEASIRRGGNGVGNRNGNGNDSGNDIGNGYANQVEVSASQVEHPVSIRYGWRNYCELSLRNSAGLPASSFRAGIAVEEPA